MDTLNHYKCCVIHYSLSNVYSRSPFRSYGWSVMFLTHCTISLAFLKEWLKCHGFPLPQDSSHFCRSDVVRFHWTHSSRGWRTGGSRWIQTIMLQTEDSYSSTIELHNKAVVRYLNWLFANFSHWHFIFVNSSHFFLYKCKVFRIYSGGRWY